MRWSTLYRTGTGLLGPARPIILYHKPTARCDCRCRFCDFWVGQPDHDDVAPSEKILALLERAGAAGMTMYTVWGGEPLLAEALPAWLERASALGMMTTVCTSGFRLPERAAELAPSLDQLLLSLEAVGERQDRLRGTPGLFARLSRGLEEFRRRARGDALIWSNVGRENRDQLEAIARFAQEMGAAVEFFPTALYPGYNDKMVLDAAERREVFAEVLDLKRRGYPIANPRYSLELMGSGRRFRCNLGRLAVQVSATGEVYHCEPRLVPGLVSLGRADEMDWRAFARSAAYREGRRKLADCNACLFPCVANMADSLWAQALRRAGNRLWYRSHL